MHERRECVFIFIHYTIFVEIGCMLAYLPHLFCVSTAWLLKCSFSLSFCPCSILVHCYYLNLLFIKLELIQWFDWFERKRHNEMCYFHWGTLLVGSWCEQWTQCLRWNHMWMALLNTIWDMTCHLWYVLDFLSRWEELAILLDPS